MGDTWHTRVPRYASVLIVGAALGGFWRAAQVPEIRYHGRHLVLNEVEVASLRLGTPAKQLTTAMRTGPHARVAAEAAIAALRKAAATQTLQVFADGAPDGDPISGLHELLLGAGGYVSSEAIKHRLAVSLTLPSATVVDITISTDLRLLGEQLLPAVASAVNAVAQRIVTDDNEAQRMVLEDLAAALNSQASAFFGSGESHSEPRFFADFFRLMIARRGLFVSLDDIMRGHEPLPAKRTFMGMRPLWLDRRAPSEEPPGYVGIDSADPTLFIARLAAAADAGLVPSSEGLALYQRLLDFLALRRDTLTRNDDLVVRSLEIARILDKMNKIAASSHISRVVTPTLSEQAFFVREEQAGITRLSVAVWSFIGAVGGAFVLAAWSILRTGIQGRARECKPTHE